ncbi:MAG: type II toxin-antitoxin system RelE/ParE family toxin [Proteobacteria bacterium]|nr:type II toxin-antitoxin system RelE/ParE family toxin [Pseudomonadota bacterium]
MSEDERVALINYLALSPLSGDVVPGTGGVRKLRWALEGRGKRGGGRVIYFFHSEKLPLFIFSMYAKNMQSDLSEATKNGLKLITKSIVESYGRAKR